MREGALDILRSDALEPIVEMALLSPGDDTYEAVAHDGRVRFRRDVVGTGWRFTVEEVEGRNPLADQALDRFAPLDAELSARFPTRTANSYPHAYEQVAQLFDHPSAPDVCVIHTAAHFWNHVGEHGSIDAVQARAPFVAAGAGVARRGLVPEACRLVDVAPTILRLLGVPPTGGTGPAGGWREDAALARQDGDAVESVLDPGGGTARHVVGLLFDGANANVLYDHVARGELPNVARLMAQGTTFAYGAVSSLPTVTLANHTSVLTGCFPGHHGVLHNAWFDRKSGQQAVTNSPATWPTAMRWLTDGIETVHHAVRRAFPGATSVAVNEPCDSGASWSTFEVIRNGEPLDRPPPLDQLPHTTHEFARPVKDYGWSSLIDHTAVEQFCGIWSGEYRGRRWERPAFTWVNFTLTDAAFHEGGPHSEIASASLRDTDARLGRILAAVDDAGAWDDTAFVLVADHGMEETHPDVRGDWGDHLRAAGIAFRDEGFGFLYLGEQWG